MLNPQMHHILVVDDLADNLFLLQTLLETEGYRVETADSGQAALSKLCKSPPDLVLLDVMMPGMDGYEVTRQIRQNADLSCIPILLITAYDQESAEAGLAAGANDFIHKPINFDELMQRMQALLNQSAASSQPNRSAHQEVNQLSLRN
jgi:CheY-like chemotaxis protein